MDEFVKLIITQLPNFVGLVFAVVVMWRIIGKLLDREDRMAERLIQMTKDCNCGGEKAQAETAIVKHQDTTY